ncbi:MAG: hypothetical protein Q9224_005115, partial [Gallowayella concinna]
MAEPGTPDLTSEGESEDLPTEAIEEEEEEDLDPFAQESTPRKTIANTNPTVRDDDPTLYGLRNINSLASWTVSTHKPTCG